MNKIKTKIDMKKKLAIAMRRANMNFNRLVLSKQRAIGRNNTEASLNYLEVVGMH